MQPGHFSAHILFDLERHDEAVAALRYAKNLIRRKQNVANWSPFYEPKLGLRLDMAALIDRCFL